MENTVFERNYEIVEKGVSEAILKLETRISLEELGAYAEPEITAERKWTQSRRWLCRRIRKITTICSTGAMTMQSGITEGFAALWTMSTGTRTSTSI
mgnify:CR=1 FL=1